MTLQARYGIGILVLASSIAAVGGCEDSAARQREQVQKAVADLSRELKLAIAGGTNSTDTDTIALQQQKINGIITRLSQVNGGEQGQQAAKAVLSATALRELANIKLVGAEQIEARHRTERDVLQGKLDAMLKLEGIAAGVSSVDTRAQRDELQHLLDAAKAHAGDLGEKITQLSGPIEERSAKNAANQEELKQLKIEVGDLRRKAQELGSADGFDTFRHSVDVKRQADKIEYDISQREIDLDYSLNPEHNLADAQLKQVQAMMQAIESTQENLNTLATATSADVNKIRADLNTLGEQVKEGIININKESEGALKAAYDEAQASLEKAAGQLQSARGDDAAKLTAVRISETLGRLHWSKAQGLAEQANLVQQLTSFDKASGGSPLEADLKSINTAHDAAVEQAKAAYTQAKEAVLQVKGADSPQLQVVQSNLQSSIDILSGKEPEPEPEPAAPAATPPKQRTTAAAPEFVPKGAESPEALVQSLKALGDRPTDMLRVFDLMTPVDQIPNITPDQRGFLKSLVKMAAGASTLDAALQRKFGKSIADLPGASAGLSGGQMPSFGDVSLGTVNGDHGTILASNPRGEQVPHEIRRINGRWFMDTPGMDAPAAASPQATQMNAFMRGMSEAFGKMGSMFQELAAAVDRGDFASFDDFKTKSDERMTEAMKGTAFGALMDQQSRPK